MALLPYITAIGNIEKALNGIKAAATPDSISQDFVKTILKIKGGSGNQITSYLKKIGFAGSDGKPTEIYTAFRNTSAIISGAAVAKALKLGYGALYKRNEYMHQLSDEDLKGLIIEETGSGKDSAVPGLILGCINALKAFSKFDNASSVDESEQSKGLKQKKEKEEKFQKEPEYDNGYGMNLSYTINLNLPATSDIAVFNAIFKSLKENLLRVKNG